MRIRRAMHKKPLRRLRYTKPRLKRRRVLEQKLTYNRRRLHRRATASYEYQGDSNRGSNRRRIIHLQKHVKRSLGAFFYIQIGASK